MAQIKEMPRKPIRYRQSLRHLPLTFSPFFRTVAQVASLCKTNHQIHESTFQKKSPPNAAGIIILLNFSSMDVPLSFLLFFPWSVRGCWGKDKYLTILYSLHYLIYVSLSLSLSRFIFYLINFLLVNVKSNVYNQATEVLIILRKRGVKSLNLQMKTVLK